MLPIAMTIARGTGYELYALRDYRDGRGLTKNIPVIQLNQIVLINLLNDQIGDYVSWLVC